MDALEWVAGWPVAAVLKGSATAYMVVNAAHILSVGLLVGAILPLDLRLTGLFRSFPVSVLGPFLSRAAAVGVMGAVLTGLCLFSVRPQEYAANPAFLTKIALLAMGIGNALLLHASAGWRLAVADGGIGLAVRAQAVLSLAIWCGALLAGRWIGFL